MNSKKSQKNDLTLTIIPLLKNLRNHNPNIITIYNSKSNYGTCIKLFINIKLWVSLSQITTTGISDVGVFDVEKSEF